MTLTLDNAFKTIANMTNGKLRMTLQDIAEIRVLFGENMEIRTMHLNDLTALDAPQVDDNAATAAEAASSAFVIEFCEANARSLNKLVEDLTSKV